jgi:protein involved in polysaccharide export with SLBB domain
MRVSDLLRAAGQLRESAYALAAELTRKHIDADQARRIEHIDIDLAAVLGGEAEFDLELLPYDVLSIREIPQWRENEYMELQGEVRFPGRYPIRRGETLADLIDRAGGLTQDAFVEGAVFVREQLKELERKNLNRMADNLERELAGFGLQQAQLPAEQQQAYQFALQLVARLRDTQAVGRLVIDLKDVLEKQGDQSEIAVVNGDKLFIPPQREEVTVMGEVFFPTSHIFQHKRSAIEYIRSSGGLTANADGKRAYIVRANGSVSPVKPGFWSRSAKVYAGDTIVVPLDADRVNKVKLWTDVTQILYQLSLAAASMKTLGVL